MAKSSLARRRATGDGMSASIAAPTSANASAAGAARRRSSAAMPAAEHARR